MPDLIDYEGAPVEVAPGQIGAFADEALLDTAFQFSPGMHLAVQLAVERSKNRRLCRRCGKRRAAYSLTVRTADGIATSSPWRCAPCAGLVLHGGRRSL